MKKSIIALTAVAFVATAVSTLSSCSAAEDALGGTGSCDGTDYNKATEFCHANTIYEKCSDKEYNPDKKECVDGRVVDKGTGGNPSSSSNGGDIPGGLDTSKLCKINNQYAFCEYEGDGATDPGGCYTVDEGWEGNDGKPCETLLAECTLYGKLFTGVNPAALSQANEFGRGLRCATLGGTAVGGSTTSSGSNTNPSSASTGTAGACKVNNQQVFCQWPTGCFEQNSEWDPDKRSCSVMLDDCRQFGLLFTGVASTNIGDGKKCNGTPVITGDNEVGRCYKNNKLIFCQWPEWDGNPGGCWGINSETNRTCADVIADCPAMFTDVDLYTGVGDGVTCEGTPVAR